ALPEARHNAVLSGLAPPLVVQGRPDCLRVPFALVVANIVAPVLHAHCADLARLTAPGGSLILSGVLDAERAHLEATYAAAGLRGDYSLSRDGWVALRLRRAP
nr:hypothetical protein [Gammaproteobacteria bacterium]